MLHRNSSILKMKTNLLTLTLLLSASVCMAQSKPKTHVYYDTVKTVHERIDYAPDTIPVYFKELIITKEDTTPGLHLLGGQLYENWCTGFVIWQTYKKSQDGIMWSSSGMVSTTSTYYRDEYQPSKGLPGQFLYADKKPCKNIILNSFKR